MAVRKNALARIIASSDGLPPLALAAHVPFGVQDQPYSGRVVASGGSGSYSYTVLSKPAWITATQVGQVLELTGTVPFNGDGDVQVTATDSFMDSVTRTFHIETGGSIQPPNTGDGSGDEFSRIIVFTVGYGSSGTYDVHALLVNPTDPVTYTLTGSLPSGSSFNSTTGVITWANITDVGLHLFEFVCIDANGGGARFSFRVTVAEEMSGPAAVSEVEVDAGSTSAVPGYARFFHGGVPPLSIEVSIPSQISGWTTYNAQSGVITTSPPLSEIGNTYNVQFTARDAIGDSVSENLGLVIVQKVKEAPENGTIYGRKDGSWTPVPLTGGTVTSVGVSTGASGVSVSGSPVTGSGTIELDLGTAAAADVGDFDAAGSAAAAESNANAYTDAEIAALESADIGYDNSTSGLSATDVQAAIDEIVAGGSGGPSGITAVISNGTNDLQVGDSTHVAYAPGDAGPFQSWAMTITPAGAVVQLDVLVGGVSITTGGSRPEITSGTTATGDLTGWAGDSVSTGDSFRVEITSLTGTVKRIDFFLSPEP